MHDHDSSTHDGPAAESATTADAGTPGKRTQAEAATIYREVGSGNIDPGRGSAVDAALATAGQGESHASGATLHTDGVAAEAASAIGANAFTAGSDVFFGAGHSPSSDGGSTLAHELTHVEQNKGVEAPSPGNYAIASPSSAQEVEASGGGGGSAGSASASTIYRDPDTFGTNMENLLTPAVGHENAAGTGASLGNAMNIAEAGTDPTKDALQAFRVAVGAGNPADIDAKWKALKIADKKKLKDETDTILKMMQSWGPDSMKALPAIGHKLGTDVRMVQHILWQANVADWKAKMSGAQWKDWIGAEPKQDALDQKSLEGLNQAIKVAGSDANAREIFNKAYPKLNTNAKVGEDDWTRLTAGAWTQARVTQLFEILTHKLPAPHIRAATGGFLLVDKMRSRQFNNIPFGPWEQLGYAYWDPPKNLVVLPLSSTGATGGGVNHDMVGGQRADSSKPAGKLTHFEGSALHEIGHAVGDNIRGHTWAQTSSPAQWNQPADKEVKGLWDAGKSQEPGGTDKKLPEGDAKEILYEFATAGTKTPPAGWTDADMDYALDTQYKQQPLFQLARTSQFKDNAYRGPVVHGGFAYAFLTRWDNKIGKYTQAAHDTKVSWYSVSSPNEWFAEQYVQFYQTNKAGSGMDGTTLAYFKDLDARSLADKGTDPAAAKAPGGEAAGADGGEAGAAPGGAATADRATDPPSGGAPAPHRGQFPFAWE